MSARAERQSSLLQIAIGAAFVFAVFLLLGSIIAADITQIIGALCFFVIPFERSRARANWARGVFFVTATLILLTGMVDFLRHRALWMPSVGVQHIVLSTVPTLRGVALGLILSLILSGQLRGQRRASMTPEPSNQSMQPTAGRSEANL